MPSIKGTIIYSLAVAAGIQAAPLLHMDAPELYHTGGIPADKWNKTVSEFLAKHPELPDRNKPYFHINPWEKHESIPVNDQRLAGDHYTMMEHRTDFPGFGVEAYCSEKHGAKPYINEMGLEHFEKELIIAADQAFNYLNRTHEWPKAVCLRAAPHTMAFAHSCISWAPEFDWKVPQPIIEFIVNRAILCNKLDRSSEVQLAPVGIPGAIYKANVCVGDTRWCNGPNPETVPTCGHHNDIYGHKWNCPPPLGKYNKTSKGSYDSSQRGYPKEAGEIIKITPGEEHHESSEPNHYM